MAVTYSVTTNLESFKLEPTKIDAVIKHYRDTVAKENVPYTVRKKQAGGSPSALRHMENQRKRRQIIAKAKERKLQRKKQRHNFS